MRPFSAKMMSGDDDDDNDVEAVLMGNKCFTLHYHGLGHTVCVSVDFCCANIVRALINAQINGFPSMGGRKEQLKGTKSLSVRN